MFRISIEGPSMKHIALLALLSFSGPALSNTAVSELSELGKKLFFDPRLSEDGSISCSSCHNVMGNGSDGRPGSVGIRGQVGGRKAPTVWNSQAYTAFFWDGRADSLEAQAKGPLTNPIEMGMIDHKAVEERLLKIGYAPEFEKVFKTKDSIKIDNFAKAVAEFERTLFVRNSKFDQFKAGKHDAISEDAKRGYKLIQEVGCVSCHNGVDFAGPQMGAQPFLMKFPMFADAAIEKQYNLSKDLGRYQVTKNDSDKNMWRVQSWRNVSLTAPYFHNGSVKTLHEAVLVMAKVQLNRDLKSKDIEDIVAFLDSLTGEFPKISMPTLPTPKFQAMF
jgi:cytochrome c peroxidase